MTKHRFTIHRNKDGLLVVTDQNAHYYRLDSGTLNATFEDLTPEAGKLDFEFKIPVVEEYFHNIYDCGAYGAINRSLKGALKNHDLRNTAVVKTTIINGKLKCDPEIVWRNEDE